MPTTNRRPYTDIQIYRDASMYLQRLIKVVLNMPRPIQFSLGEQALKHAMRVVQLMRLSYEATKEDKVRYIYEARELMACLEIEVNQLYEGRFISLKAKAYLYITIGSMQKQLRAWRGKVEKDVRDDSKLKIA